MLLVCVRYSTRQWRRRQQLNDWQTVAVFEKLLMLQANQQNRIFPVYSRRLHEQTENISVWLWHMSHHLIISCRYAVVALGQHVALWHSAIQRPLSYVPLSRPAFDKPVHTIIFSSQHIWPRLLNLSTYILCHIAYANVGFLSNIIIIIVVVVLLNFSVPRGFFFGHALIVVRLGRCLVPVRELYLATNSPEVCWSRPNLIYVIVPRTALHYDSMFLFISLQTGNSLMAQQREAWYNTLMGEYTCTSLNQWIRKGWRRESDGPTGAW